MRTLRTCFNMAAMSARIQNSVLDLLTFLGNVPQQIEQACRCLFTQNLGALEEWHIRLESTINLLSVLSNRVQVHQQGQNHDEDLLALLNEVRRVH